METCPHHSDPQKCASRARALTAKLEERAAATEALESVVWEALDRRLRRKWAASFLEENDPCDCWKVGGLPMPSLTRSALLFHCRLPSGQTPAQGAIAALRKCCPVLREFIEAQAAARLSFFRIGLESRHRLELIDAANGELRVVESPFSPGWMKPGYLLFARVFTFRGVDFLGESEGMPLANRTADEAEDRLLELAPGDPKRTEKLFEIFFDGELTGLEGEAAEDEEPAAPEIDERLVLRKGGNMPN